MSRAAIARWMRRLRQGPALAKRDRQGGTVAFVCNLCGAANAVPQERLGREIPSCCRCGSTVRWRALAHLVCEAVLGRGVVLADAPPRRDVRGLGLSDDACVARALGRCFDYTNTFFHAEPHLDIAAPVPDHVAGRYDFVTASDVFEHVAPPVSVAFANARRLLRPGGALVLTVPFSLEPHTIEHFPELHEFTLAEEHGRWRLRNRTRDGRVQCFDDVVFHGGPGTTVEMRLFSRAALERHFAEAGFRSVRFADEPCPRFGIAWPQPWSVPMVGVA